MKKPQNSMTTPLKSVIPSLTSVRGIALAAVLMLLLVITLIGTLSLRMSREQQTASMNLRDLTRAQFAAEQAVREAIDLPIWSVDPDPDNPDYNWIHVVSAPNAGTDYGYSYTIRHKQALGSVAVDSEGFPIYVVQSEGTSGNARRQLEVAVVSQFKSISVVEDAFIGCRGIPYNSSGTIGSYRSDGQFTTGDNANIKTIEADADVTIDSNATLRGYAYITGDLQIDSNARIMKDAYANGGINLGSNSTIVGAAWSGESVTIGVGASVGQSNSNVDPDPVPVQDCDPLDIDTYIATNTSGITTPNTAYYYGSNTPTTMAPGQYKFTDFTMDYGGVLQLSPGDYTWFIDGDLSISSNAGVRFATGTTMTIYITGQFELDSNSYLGAASPGDLPTYVVKPANLAVFSSAENTTMGLDFDAMVSMRSNTGFMGVVYAPKAHVVFNSNNQSWGAVRGRWSQMDSNADYLYDETLADEVTFTDVIDLGYKVVYWTEQSYDSYDTLNTSTVSTTSTTSTSTTAPTTTTTTTTTTTAGTSTTTTSTTTTTTLAAVTFETSAFNCSDGSKTFSFNLRQATGQDCTIAQIDFPDWPSGNGKFDKLEIDNTTATKGGPMEPGGSIGNSKPWANNSDSLRTLSAGTTKSMEFIFKNGAKSGLYEMTIRFGDLNCPDVEVSYSCN